MDAFISMSETRNSVVSAKTRPLSSERGNPQLSKDIFQDGVCPRSMELPTIETGRFFAEFLEQSRTVFTERPWKDIIRFLILNLY